MEKEILEKGNALQEEITKLERFISSSGNVVLLKPKRPRLGLTTTDYWSDKYSVSSELSQRIVKTVEDYIDELKLKLEQL